MRFTTLLGLVIASFVLVGCSIQLVRDTQNAEPVQRSQQSASQITPSPQKEHLRSPAEEAEEKAANEKFKAEQDRLKAEILKLQEENARLKTQVGELQQKLAAPTPKKKEKPKVQVFSPLKPKNHNPMAQKTNPVAKKPSRVQNASAPRSSTEPNDAKVASSPKKQKKQKVIQISFEDEKTPPSKN